MRLVSPLAILVLWQFASVTRLLPADKVPAPTTLAVTAVHVVTTPSPAYGTLQGALLVSLQRAAIGFVLGATAGVLLAVVAG